MELTHVDEQGRARMVDVSPKPDTRRVAVARGQVRMRRETLALIQQNALSKGDALATARIAGILAAKKTADLIPLCHPLMLTHISVEFELSQVDNDGTVEITAEVETTGKTGVEMEALTAVSVAALTIYDMGKAVDRAMQLTNIRLIEKHGGKSGDIVLEKRP
jgi:cyclic pyranopterin phosphate synthase